MRAGAADRRPRARRSLARRRTAAQPTGTPGGVPLVRGDGRRPPPAARGRRTPRPCVLTGGGQARRRRPTTARASTTEPGAMQRDRSDAAPADRRDSTARRPNACRREWAPWPYPRPPAPTGGGEEPRLAEGRRRRATPKRAASMRTWGRRAGGGAGDAPVEETETNRNRRERHGPHRQQFRPDAVGPFDPSSHMARAQANGGYSDAPRSHRDLTAISPDAVADLTGPHRDDPRRPARSPRGPLPPGRPDRVAVRPHRSRGGLR
jgi:hypothetical protein